MKRTVAIVSMLALMLSLNIAYAKPGNQPKGQPFASIWAAINTLQAQLDVHTHSGGGVPGPVGPQGPAGPRGPQGPRGISGAGSIAFIDDDSSGTSTVFTLKTNGEVWSRISGGSWINSNMTVPTSTGAIVQFESKSFLDIAGNIWQWNGSAWVNVSHP